jgi:hypothetical protein
MAYRYFVDADGQRWRVWDVKPTLIDRRCSVRRLTAVRIRHRERRVLPTRRIDLGRSRLYFPPTEQGWLCFESDRERIRVAPIPQDWLLLDDDALAGLKRR